MMARIFAALAAERYLQGIHLAGGEPACDWEGICLALCLAAENGVRIDYVETNASWCENEDTGREIFLRLQKAGLKAVLISASLFHLEFIPLRKTLAAIKAAEEVFGPGGVIVWTPDALAQMAARLDHNRTFTLAESCRTLGMTRRGEDLWRWHGYLVAGGRAAAALTAGLRLSPVEAFAASPCRQQLENTTHFHIDLHGNLFTGLCPGISPADVNDLHPQLTARTAPIYTTLCEKGPCGLLALARENGISLALRKGYADKCHLCCVVRHALFQTNRYPELRPAEYYAHWPNATR